MIYNEFDDTPGPPEIKPVLMCPTFAGCWIPLFILALICLVASIVLIVVAELI